MQDYVLTDTENLYEVFAESLLSGFVDYTKVTPREIPQSMDGADED